LVPSSTRWSRYFSAILCGRGLFAASRAPQCQNRSHYRPLKMPWESRVAPVVVVQPPCPCRCRPGLSTRSSSSLPNPVVRYVVSSTPQTSNESVRPARRDSCRQRRRPNVRGDPDELFATTGAIKKKGRRWVRIWGILYRCFNDTRCG